jgi:uncharacterized protein
MARSRVIRAAPPQRQGQHKGLCYALFEPSQAPLGGVIILHGAGSSKESHYDFARLARAHGLAALAFDQRGHGDSEGRLDGRAIADVAAMAELLPAGRLALRGSSMGGYLALVAAGEVGAAAVVAICPASAGQLRRALRRGEFEFAADREALDRLLADHDALQAAAALDAALLLMHAEGDERVPVEHSRELFAAARREDKRLIVMPGGHHRSIQHDPELQDASMRHIVWAMRAG